MAEETLVVTDEILERYKTEILLKAKWTHDSIMEAYSTWSAIEKGEYDGKAEEVMRKFIAGITNAMSIVRILNVAGARNKIYAEKRVEAIKNKWPNLPEAPQGLKQIRDDLEHFEERLDTWAFTSSTHSIVDLNLGLSKEGFWAFGGSLGAGEKEFLRNIDEKDNFLFWNHEVKIDDVLQWVKDINKQIGK